ncbi:MAG: ABC transporter permease [Acetatifactor sp.]|nr:ABC transporter permease [Acetatifactor sp.]
MSGFCTYLYIQFRRVLKLLPLLMMVTLVVFGCGSVFATLYFNSDAMTENSQKYQVAVVGDTTSTYLGFGISALSMLDDSRFMVDLPAMTESEARRALMLGEITAYAKVPEDMVESIVNGTNDAPITIVGSTGQKSITGFFVEELTEVVSTLVIRSQSAIYGMQNILWNHGLGDKWWEATESLNLRLIDMVLKRTQLSDLEVLGLSNGLSTGEYYFISLLIFFLLLSGINSSPLFVRRSSELMRLMASRGVGTFQQVTGEYLAYLLLNLCCLLGVFIALMPVFGNGAISFAGWEGMGADMLIGFYVRLIPVAATVAAMQFLLYELVTGVVTGILLQFICGISMAYISGYFYPASMFPDILKHIGELLPTGLALRYADAKLMGEASLTAGIGLMMYLAMFLVLSGFVRRCRIQRG